MVAVLAAGRKMVLGAFAADLGADALAEGRESVDCGLPKTAGAPELSDVAGEDEVVAVVLAG